MEKVDNDILLEWATTYGDDEDDVKASRYNAELMIEFAQYYHQQVKNNDSLDNVSKRFLAIGTLSSGKSFKYAEEAQDMGCFLKFIETAYPNFYIDSITEI